MHSDFLEILNLKYSVHGIRQAGHKHLTRARKLQAMKSTLKLLICISLFVMLCDRTEGETEQLGKPCGQDSFILGHCGRAIDCADDPKENCTELGLRCCQAGQLRDVSPFLALEDEHDSRSFKNDP